MVSMHHCLTCPSLHFLRSIPTAIPGPIAKNATCLNLLCALTTLHVFLELHLSLLKHHQPFPLSRILQGLNPVARHRRTHLPVFLRLMFHMVVMSHTLATKVIQLVVLDYLIRPSSAVPLAMSLVTSSLACPLCVVALQAFQMLVPSLVLCHNRLFTAPQHLTSVWRVTRSATAPPHSMSSAPTGSSTCTLDASRSAVVLHHRCSMPYLRQRLTLSISPTVWSMIACLGTLLMVTPCHRGPLRSRVNQMGLSLLVSAAKIVVAPLHIFSTQSGLKQPRLCSTLVTPCLSLSSSTDASQVLRSRGCHKPLPPGTLSASQMACTVLSYRVYQSMTASDILVVPLACVLIST